LKYPSFPSCRVPSSVAALVHPPLLLWSRPCCCDKDHTSWQLIICSIMSNSLLFTHKLCNLWFLYFNITEVSLLRFWTDSKENYSQKFKIKHQTEVISSQPITILESHRHSLRQQHLHDRPDLTLGPANSHRLRETKL
jgi:hypothetical protein